MVGISWWTARRVLRLPFGNSLSIMTRGHTEWFKDPWFTVVDFLDLDIASIFILLELSEAFRGSSSMRLRSHRCHKLLLVLLLISNVNWTFLLFHSFISMVGNPCWVVIIYDPFRWNGSVVGIFGGLSERWEACWVSIYHWALVVRVDIKECGWILLLFNNHLLTRWYTHLLGGLGPTVNVIFITIIAFTSAIFSTIRSAVIMMMCSSLLAAIADINISFSCNIWTSFDIQNIGHIKLYILGRSRLSYARL